MWNFDFFPIGDKKRDEQKGDKKTSKQMSDQKRDEQKGDKKQVHR